MRLAVIGAGRMGAAVRAEARARGHEVSFTLGSVDNRHGAGILPERFAGVEGAIEFTRPDAAAANVERLLTPSSPDPKEHA